MSMPITVRLATKADIKQSLSSRRTAGFRPGSCPLWVSRVGLIRRRWSRHVRFAPQSGHRELVSTRPLSAAALTAAFDPPAVRLLLLPTIVPTWYFPERKDPVRPVISAHYYCCMIVGNVLLTPQRTLRGPLSNRHHDDSAPDARCSHSRGCAAAPAAVS
jgi:hypothetical protein